MNGSLILPILNVCAKDEASALLSLKMCEKFGCTKDAGLMVSHDASYDPANVVEAAKRAFKTVSTFQYDEWKGEKSWPHPQTWAWQKVARHASFIGGNGAWLWWEADAVPMRKNWLKTLSQAYNAAPRMLFAGVPCGDRATPFYMNGVGVYPMRILEALDGSPALFVVNEAFDRSAGRNVRQSFKSLDGMIIHHRKPFGGADGAHFDKAASDELLLSNPAAVLYHGVTDGSLQSSLLGLEVKRPVRNISVNGRSAFYHSGDLGDVVYSLLTVRELGGGEIYLGPDNRTNMATRQKFGPQVVANIVPLLEAQHYIHSAQYAEVVPEHNRYDLNQMRVLLRNQQLDMKPGYNLARCYLETFGLSMDNDASRWLDVDARTVAPVVINRSSRYQNPNFRWDRVLKQYRGQCVFVGLPDEHKAFCREWGDIPHEPTRNLLELAQVIAGARLFAGNQSCAYAIAEGLKKDALLETCPSGSNTLFNRESVIRDVDEHTALPPIGAKRTRPKLVKHLTVSGPIDWFTGLGRATCQLIAEASKTYKVRVEPTSQDFRTPVPTAVLKAMANTHKGPPSPRILVSPLLDVPRNLRPDDLLYTMWESTRFNPKIVEVINAKASVLATPSSWCATVFGAHGVVAPIEIVPLGVEPVKPVEKLQCSPVTFGAAGRLAHGGKRKGIEDVIKAFCAAFPKGDEPVKLSLKLFDDCKTPEIPKDNRIEVITRTLTDAEMDKWYRGLTCFVCASKAEGWGLHVHEAMAIGIPVIAPNYSGLADLVSNSTGLVLPWKVTEATEGYLGQWCQPDDTELSTWMKSVFSDPKSAVISAHWGVTKAQRLTPAHFAKALTDLLA